MEQLITKGSIMDQRVLQKSINLSAPLLITGETGTGKSFLAKNIFDLSRIHKERFLTAHLASLKEDLLESELFGYKKGAFTGAAKDGVPAAIITVAARITANVLNMVNISS